MQPCACLEREEVQLLSKQLCYRFKTTPNIFEFFSEVQAETKTFSFNKLKVNLS